MKLFVPQGCGLVVERRGQHHHVPDGHLLVLDPESATSGVPQGEGSWHILSVGPAFVSAAVGPGRFRLADPVVRDVELAAAVADVVGQLVMSGDATALSDLFALIAARTMAPQPVLRDAARGVAEEAVAHLRDVTDRNVSLAELARIIGVDKYMIVHACTRHYGIPPHTLHLRLRIDRARALIARGHPLAEVGHDTGFYDQAHFTRTFTRASGMTPATYAASARQVVAVPTKRRLCRG